MSSNPCFTGLRWRRPLKRQSWATYGSIAVGQCPWECGLGCTPVLSVTQKRRCSSSMWLVALLSAMPFPFTCVKCCFTRSRKLQGRHAKNFGWAKSAAFNLIIMTYWSLQKFDRLASCREIHKRPLLLQLTNIAYRPIVSGTKCTVTHSTKIMGGPYSGRGLSEMGHLSDGVPGSSCLGEERMYRGECLES